MALLTKSKYMAGLQCPKYLWTIFNDKGKIPEHDKNTLHMFEQGHLIGELAKKLFPGGIDVPAMPFMDNINKTKELISSGKVLFEPGFMIDNLFARADVLVPVKDEWDLIEVKSSTRVKEEHIEDVAFQKLCYEKSGLKIGKCFLMHINSEYVKKGKIDLKKLLIKEDITKEVNLVEGVQERIDSMFKIINSDISPDSCKSPKNCPMKENCWGFLPTNNVFALSGGGKKSISLFESGIVDIKDIPDDFKLNEKQQIQRECAKTGKINIHKKNINNFLKTLKEPLYYLDFETFSTAIPMFDGTSPYQQIPFQFSLHVVENDNIKHHEFLADGKEDPRLTLLKEMKKVFGDKGSIVVYYQSFEKNILKKLAEAFPEYDGWVESVLARIVDLLIPFRNFSYYNPEQKGSASIKDVLPAITGKSYEGMDINEGQMASLEYLRITYGDADKEDIVSVRKALLEYCKLDTEAMVLIVDKLRDFEKV